MNPLFAIETVNGLAPGKGAGLLPTVVALAADVDGAGLSAADFEFMVGQAERTTRRYLSLLIDAGLVHKLDREGRHGGSRWVLSELGKKTFGTGAVAVPSPSNVVAIRPAADVRVDTIVSLVADHLDSVGPISAPDLVDLVHVEFAGVIDDLELEASEMATIRNRVLGLVVARAIPSSVGSDITSFLASGAAGSAEFAVALRTVKEMSGSTGVRSWGSYLNKGWQKRYENLRSSAEVLS